MQIRDEDLEYGNKDSRNKKILRIILIFMVLLFIAIIAIACTVMYIQKGAFRTYIDGVGVNLHENTVIVDPNTKKVYIDIRGIASYLGYDSHNGEYKLYTEDTNKCWVNNKNETASFYLNSNKISKVVPNTTKDYEDYTIEEPVVSIDGKLYSSIEGIRIGFNVLASYNEESNSLQITTLPNLVKSYDAVLKKYGYSGVSEKFENQKAILYGLFIVRKDNNLFGVIDANNNEIIGSRYTNIEFNECVREFYVRNSSNRVGIVTEKGDTKINLIYDSISMIDKKNGLYLVQDNSKVGVLGNTGNIIIHLEYDEIGADPSKFPSNNITNKYVLFENAIPVRQDKYWGLFDIKGNIIVPLEFDQLGYTGGSKALNDKSVNNILVIPNYKAIVLGKEMEITGENNSVTKEKKYAIYNNVGKELVPCAVDNAYSVINSGVNTYYMQYKGQTLDIEKYIERVHGAYQETNLTTSN